MSETAFHQWARAYREAWNSKNVDVIVAMFADPMSYRDAETHTPITDRHAFVAYVTKFLGAWDIDYEIREVIPFAGVEGGLIEWRATARLSGSTKGVQGEGVDLVFLKNGKIERAESWYDRVPYMPLIAEARRAKESGSP